MNKLFFVLVAFLVSCAGGIAPPPPPMPASDAGAVAPVPKTFGVTLETDAETDAPPPPVCPTPVQLDTDLTAATQAAVIGLSGVLPLTCPEVVMAQTWAGGKLIFSDSPETPTAKAKLYEDATLAATEGVNYNRVFAYHVNGQTAKAKFTVLVKNLGTASGTLTIQKKGIAGPSTSYLYTGKLAFQRYLDSVAGAGVNVSAGATVQLDSTFEVSVTQNYLQHGIWDYSFTQPHKIMICMLNTTDNSVNVCPGLAVAARDTHKRGTFPFADKVYDTASGVVVDTASGIQQFPIAGGTANDEFAVGMDVTDGTQMTNAGNYGILYRMHMNLSASNGQNLGFLFNPRAGQWGGAVFSLAGVTPGGKFLIPVTSGSTGDNTKGAVEAKYNPAVTASVWLQFMPTGGSSFPLRMLAVPH